MFLLIRLFISHLLIVCAQFATFFDKKNFAIFRARKMAQDSCAKKLAQFFRFFLQIFCTALSYGLVIFFTEIFEC